MAGHGSGTRALTKAAPSCLVSLFLLAGCEWNRPALAAADSVPVAAVDKPTTSQPEKRLQRDENEESDSSVQHASYQPTPPPDPAHVADRVRAVINGVAILDSEVKDACYPQLMATQSMSEPERSARRAEIFRQQLDQIIDREVILQDLYQRLAKQKRVLEKLDEAADKEFDKRLKAIKEHNPNIKTDEDIKKAFKSMGLSMEGFRRQVKRDFMAREYMRNLLFPAVDDGIQLPQIREYYMQHMEEFKQDDRVEWQDIFIDKSKFANRDEARRMAQQVAGLARSGQDFLRLAAQYDKENSGFGKAEGLGQRKGEIRPTECEAYLFQMKPGDIGPVVELPTGFHVFRLVKRDFAGQTPFNEKVQDEIRKKLQMQIFEREFQYVIKDLKQKARWKVLAD
jgi:parvulin-like peptidyl-prolyl isomerase